MRTGEERINAMHRRAGELRIEKRHRRVRVIQAASAVCCCAAVLVLAVLMPRIAGTMDAGVLPQGMNGSLFANSPVLSYVVIAVIAFMLGITVTAICYQLKKYQNEKDAEDLQC